MGALYPFPRHSRGIAMQKEQTPELLQGTLDMMILKTLSVGPNHGYGIVRRIRQVSDDVLSVEEGSLYPALHRLEKRGCLAATWKPSESNRRAKYYRLTAKGRRQLGADEARWSTLSRAIGKVLGQSPANLLAE
jgi:PadR family transcriptional regulator PadR